MSTEATRMGSVREGGTEADTVILQARVASSAVSDGSQEGQRVV